MQVTGVQTCALPISCVFYHYRSSPKSNMQDTRFNVLNPKASKNQESFLINFSINFLSIPFTNSNSQYLRKRVRKSYTRPIIILNPPLAILEDNNDGKGKRVGRLRELIGYWVHRADQLSRHMNQITIIQLITTQHSKRCRLSN